MLVNHAPIPSHIYSASSSNIRLALPHWTPSRYHTAPISEVIDEIETDLVAGKPLIKVYNSNLNPRNRRAYNDRYILLITACKSLLIDIKRRTTIQFQQEPSLSKLTLRLQKALLILSIISYTVMQCLFQTVLVPNIAVMQLTVVASWCFLIGFIVAFIAFFLSLTKQEQDRQRMEMLRSENTLMADNYKALHSTQQEYARKLHDFKHHVRTVHELISDGKVESALEYTDSLLKTSYQQAVQCHSGNDIVDAIINFKLAEAQVKKIQFTYMANLHIPIQIDPVDLCGVLANQLENAFEACMQISEPDKRIVHAEIKQVQSFVILRVENSVLSDPFVDNPDLKSTKSASATPHGYGLLNIRSIAQKYEGSLRTEFANNRFISVVSLCDLPFDTNHSTVG